MYYLIYETSVSKGDKMGIDARKPVWGLQTTKAQTSLWGSAYASTQSTNAFVIHFLERIISKLATGEISSF